MRKSILSAATSILILSGIAGVAASVGAISASAEHNYSCGSCATINGPDETA